MKKDNSFLKKQCFYVILFMYTLKYENDEYNLVEKMAVSTDLSR